MSYRKKLIEVSLPLEAINEASSSEKAVPRHGHPQTLHLWWARRPLAAARAILFSQLVDDPSSWPEVFPTEHAQIQERQRLFELISRLVQWENTNDAAVTNAARLEIARSHARSSASPKAHQILDERVSPALVNDYLATELPPVHDPFAGGGTIPLEAQRLGLRAIASDLNPVAVMINKALIEIPPRFASMSPVSPEAQQEGKLRTWRGAEGLAADVRHYGSWVCEEARRRVGHLYPQVAIPDELGGGRGPVVAWLWARTVQSPNPAFEGCHVPLVSSFWLSNKPGKEFWIEPIIAGRTVRFEVRNGKPSDTAAIGAGTKLGRGANFRCILSNTPMEPDHIKREGSARRLGTRLMAMVVEGKKGRVYVAPTEEDERLARSAQPTWTPEGDVPARLTGGTCHGYGLTSWGDLFTSRQLAALSAFSDLIPAAIQLAKEAAPPDAAEEYSAAVGVYLTFCLSKLADWSSSICGFIPGYGKYRDTFARQAIPMTWDFAELNPFGDAVGNWLNHVEWVSEAIEALPRDCVAGTVHLADAAEFVNSGAIVSTDPPYYDNISYADLSDFFYVWLRRVLRDRYSDTFRTMLVPKKNELVAAAYRHGSREAADTFFLDGMRSVLQRLCLAADGYAPTTIYYAYRQSETGEAGSSSTGWDSFLTAIYETGHLLEATWPIRTEREGRSNSQEANSLASSVVLVCRKRPDDAPTTTRGDFRRLLRKELPDALKKLQQGNIAPVDVAQASIGPGMAIFSRHKQVLEANGVAMTVKAALQLINEVLDEYLASGEGDFDADTRFAITWYEQYGWDAGPFGDAETLAKARNVSVSGVVEAGICHSAPNKVRILKRQEMRPLEYDPATDERPTIWEFTQHMIRLLETEGEESAARLLKKLGSASDATRELAYRLYNTCERKKWAEDARSYNGLILAWPELEKLAAKIRDDEPPTTVSHGGSGGTAAKKGGKKTKAQKKGQQNLFAGDDK